MPDPEKRDPVYDLEMAEHFHAGVRSVRSLRPPYREAKWDMPRLLFPPPAVEGLVRVGPLAANPYFRAEFQRVVPEAALTRDGDGWRVACPCGAEAVRTVYGHLSECPGACSRWFLQTEQRVRVAYWPQEQAA